MELDFDVERQDEYVQDSIRPGILDVRIVSAEYDTTKAGDGRKVSVCLELLSGPSAGRRLWDHMLIEHPVEKAKKIGRSRLCQLCRSVGIHRLTDTDQLVGLETVADVREARSSYSGVQVCAYGRRTDISIRQKKTLMDHVPADAGSEEVPF